MQAKPWQYALAAQESVVQRQGHRLHRRGRDAWQFTPGTTFGTYTTPAGLQQTLTKVDTDTTRTSTTLKGWTSNSTTHFNLADSPPRSWTANQNQVKLQHF